ncbi:MAG: DNA-directed RNA polymerase subunit alpha, partial [Bacilli bacterium]
MRKFEFIKPQAIIDAVDDNSHYGKFTITPLERGYGITLGNTFRRVLLSSMPGISIVSMDIEGVEHEFMAIPGVHEDMTEIVLNLKNVILSIDDSDLFKVMPHEKNDLYEMTLIAEGPGVIHASDLVKESNIKVVNPDLVIATMDVGAKIKGRFYARRGVGYVSANENKAFSYDKSGNKVTSRIAIDSIYTPIVRCKYDVEKVRVGDQVDYDKLSIEIWTNGSIKPADALSL